MKAYKFILGIETIFDTVLGFYKQHYPSVVLGLNEKDYYGRVHNDLPRITGISVPEDELKQLWDKRDFNTLKYSDATPILNNVIEEIAAMAGPIERPDSRPVEVTINTYPIVIPEEDTIEICKYIAGILGIDNVGHVSLNYGQLSPKYLKENANYFTISNFNDWIGYHHLKALPSCPIPSITCIAPILLLDSKRDVEVLNDKELDMAGYIQKVCAATLNVELIPLGAYSAHTLR